MVAKENPQLLRKTLVAKVKLLLLRKRHGCYGKNIVAREKLLFVRIAIMAKEK